MMALLIFHIGSAPIVVLNGTKEKIGFQQWKQKVTKMRLDRKKIKCEWCGYILKLRWRLGKIERFTDGTIVCDKCGRYISK